MKSPGAPLPRPVERTDQIRFVGAQGATPFKGDRGDVDATSPASFVSLSDATVTSRGGSGRREVAHRARAKETGEPATEPISPGVAVVLALTAIPRSPEVDAPVGTGNAEVASRDEGEAPALSSAQILSAYDAATTSKVAGSFPASCEFDAISWQAGPQAGPDFNDLGRSQGGGEHGPSSPVTGSLREWTQPGEFDEASHRISSGAVLAVGNPRMARSERSFSYLDMTASHEIPGMDETDAPVERVVASLLQSAPHSPFVAPSEAGVSNSPPAGSCLPVILAFEQMNQMRQARASVAPVVTSSLNLRVMTGPYAWSDVSIRLEGQHIDLRISPQGEAMTRSAPDGVELRHALEGAGYTVGNVEIVAPVAAPPVLAPDNSGLAGNASRFSAGSGEGQRHGSAREQLARRDDAGPHGEQATEGVRGDVRPRRDGLYV